MNKTQPSIDQARWQALCERRQCGAHPYFYGVITTGIFCRPGCSSRLPKRDHVRFFDSIAQAQAASFRPCKRCKPLNIKGDEITARVESLCQHIQTCLHQGDKEPGLAELAQVAGISEYHLQRQFKRVVGISPKAYAKALRQQALPSTLAQASSTTQALADAGFNHGQQFYRQARQQLGMTPSQYKRGGEAMMIEYAIAQSSLGLMLAAQTGQGLCAILLDDNEPRLIADLQARFPKATLQRAGEHFSVILEQLLLHLDKPQQTINLPLDIRGTVFQQKVWQALQQIPLGETRSYTQIAQAIGDKKAVRAVAGACAANSLAVLIPCHRVVRSDGGLSGYRWGVERKRELLSREAIAREAEVKAE